MSRIESNRDNLYMWVEIKKKMLLVPIEYRSNHFTLFLKEIDGYIFELLQILTK
jgi:hypothetical protein